MDVEAARVHRACLWVPVSETANAARMSSNSIWPSLLPSLPHVAVSLPYITLRYATCNAFHTVHVPHRNFDLAYQTDNLSLSCASFCNNTVTAPTRAKRKGKRKKEKREKRKSDGTLGWNTVLTRPPAVMLTQAHILIYFVRVMIVSSDRVSTVVAYTETQALPDTPPECWRLASVG